MNYSGNSSGHSDLGPELRLLAQAILDRLDPAVRAAATKAAEAMRGPGRCEQVWCPVCALMALLNGEQHPMLNLVAEHGVTLMTVVRAMAETQAAGQSERAPQATDTAAAEDADADAPAADPAAAASSNGSPNAPNGSANGSANGHYHHIPIVVETLETIDPSA